MGQQQLLLLVLGIVIVGIAVVAGIQAFSEGKAKAEQDAAVSDATRIISDTQAWMLKPTAFGGGDISTGTATINFSTLGYPSDAVDSDGNYKTVNGCYNFTSGSWDGTDTNGGTGTNPAVKISSLSDTDACDSEIATVQITGPDPGDIDWTYATGS